ncbi:AMIN domain-containing protein, partial [Microcoleus sp. MON2_D5]|uniref:AMIN domain-containing protein n=1 Tax=Microcoleus sp. MON2_D5 TaxID=2818833 RepID=UPI002FCED29F
MKLRVPFLCVALLSVGIMPVAAAGPRSFSDSANSDSAEATPAIARAPSSVNPSTADDGTQWWAIPSVIPSQKQLAEKPSSESEELEAKVSVENRSQKLNSHLTVASEDNRNIKKSSSEAGRMPDPQGLWEISNSDRAFPNPDIEPITDIPKLNDIDRPSTSVEGLLEPSPSSFLVSEAVRISQSVVQVTGVKLNPTAAGLEVILETEAGQLLQAITRTEGKSAIADIENAQLALPSGEEFRAQNPDRGIA